MLTKMAKMLNLESFLTDKRLLDEIRKKLESPKPFPRTEQWNIKNATIRAVIAPEAPSPEGFQTRPFSEAIVLA
jgi:hypothetical protein